LPTGVGKLKGRGNIPPGDGGAAGSNGGAALERPAQTAMSTAPQPRPFALYARVYCPGPPQTPLLPDRPQIGADQEHGRRNRQIVRPTQAEQLCPLKVNPASVLWRDPRPGTLRFVVWLIDRICWIAR